MKSTDEFLTAVYARADAEKRRLRGRRLVLFSALALAAAVPALLFLRQGTVKPMSDVNTVTEQTVSEHFTDAPATEANVTGAPAENYTGAPAIPDDYTGSRENDTAAPPTTLPPQEEIITVNPSEGYVVIDNSVLIEPERYSAVCIPVNESASSLSGDTVPARREAYLICTPAELAAASRALGVPVPAEEDCLEEYVLLVSYLAGYSAASFSETNLRVYTEGYELIAEVSHAPITAADALLCVKIDRGCVSYVTSASAAVIVP